MKKRRRINIPCVYCGRRSAGTKDHVIPKSLFLSPLPSNMITVPICRACNLEKSRSDGYLRDMLVCDIHASRHPVALALRGGAVIRSARRGRSEFARMARERSKIAPLYSPGGVYLG